MRTDLLRHLWILLSFVGVVSCVQTHRSITQEEREGADSLVMSIRDLDSLIHQQKVWEERGDLLESETALRQLGKRYRETGDFAMALEAHNRGLDQAEELQDTLSIVRALNDMGTDYRRMDLLAPATEFHIKALRLCEQQRDTTYITRKNRVISLNGLANVYLAIGNLERADSVLRMALAGEQELGSPLGQAINYANIGSIFEQQGAIDSAWYYYQQSMAYNRQAASDLGVGLCHTYYGSLYERQGAYDKAIAEYTRSYEIMSRTGDDWHMLNALLALANVYQTTGHTDQALELLKEAQTRAEQLQSLSHLSDIYRIYYDCYQQSGDYRRALECYVRSSDLSDSIVDMKKINNIQNISLNVERARNEQNMAKQEQVLAQERKTKLIGYIIAGILLLLALGGVLLGGYITRLRAKTYHQLKSLSKMREEFFTNITHEFRTPLTVINGLSREIAEDDQNSTELRTQAQVINRQGNTLLSLINQLLDIAKVKSAVGNDDYRHGDILAYIQMSVEVYQQFAAQKEISLENNVSGRWLTDFIPNYIDKVLGNLISNAIKYTPEGGKIVVSASQQESDTLLLSVSDSGIGIAEEDKARLFDPFFQIDSKYAVGSGIGLALVRQIVSSLGGSIKVDSELGSGSTFTISLPLQKTGQVAPPLMTEDQPIAPPQDIFSESIDNYPSDAPSTIADAKRILIIEDHGDVARYIGSQLSDSYQLYYASDGQSGLTKAQELIPDVIITDLMMPGLDGYQVCQGIRSHELTNHIPIIIVTAKVTESDRIQGFAAGADAYLTKPFHSEELQAVVVQLIKQRKLLYNKYAQQDNASAPTLPAEAPISESEQAIESANTMFLHKVVDVVYLLIASRSKTDVATVATKLFMSESQLYRKLSAITDLSPAAYIQGIKLSRAKQLIDKSPQMTLTEVSEVSGFADYSGFVRAFKKLYGVTPSVYKRSGLTNEESQSA